MRTGNVIRNSWFALVSQAVTIILKALVQVVFVRTLNAQYLGINGLFSNILGMLALAELGVGSAILYNMYSPVAKNDTKRIKALMNFYKSAYIKIGVIVFVAGIALVPWLDVLIKDKPDIANLQLIYILYVFNNAISYFFTYKQTILIASQQNYIITKAAIIKNIGMNIVQIIFLLITHKFLPYLVISIISTVIFNVYNSYIADKMYPYLKENKEYLSKEERKLIYKDIYAMMAHKIGWAIVNGTDNLLLSAYIGITAVGIYSNYVLVLTSVKGFLNQVYDALLSSIGNLVNTETEEIVYVTYKKLYLLSFWITGLISIGFSCLVNPLVRLVFGEEYLLGDKIVLIMALNFYVSDLAGIRAITNKFKSAYGLFWKDRYRPYFESFINLAASIALLKYFGFIGILLGTLVSTLCTCFWIEPFVLFKYGFHKSMGEYIKSYIKYFFMFVFAWFVTRIMTLWVNTWLEILCGFVVCLFVPCVIFWLGCRRSQEFNELVAIVKNILAKIFKRRLG